MLIVSDFHDYYDSITAFGIDKTVVYQRKTIVLKIPKVELPIRNGLATLSTSWDWSFQILGFCGTLYPVIRVYRKVKTDVTVEANLFTPGEVISSYEAKGIKLEKRSWRSRWFRFLDSRADLDWAFDPANWKQLLPLFQQHKAPVFLIANVHPRSTQLTLNPHLKELRFQTIKDPFTAFQDIYLYISGVLGTPARQALEISDKDKAKSKGHDGKYSFKKPPGGGRWR